jgi:FkbM family methyltransferase
MSDNITNFLSKDLNKESISIHTIDNFCESNKIDNINFLKIDIEGYEMQCLK